MVLGFVYLYNFFTLRNSVGLGARFFRYSLFLLAAALFEHAIIFVYLYNPAGAHLGGLPAPRNLCGFRAALRAGVRRDGDVGESQIDRIPPGGRLDHCGANATTSTTWTG